MLTNQKWNPEYFDFTGNGNDIYSAREFENY